MEEGRRAASDEQAVLARWSGWGAVPLIFDEEATRFATERIELRRLLGTEQAWAQARRTVLNAHYTPASVVQAMWSAAGRLGFDRGRVLEPGCGAGNFLGFAPAGAAVVGVELDPTTAEIARHLYGGRHEIHASAFEQFRPEGEFDLAIGNVPFADVRPHDPAFNRQHHSLHNYFLIKSLSLVRPGGLVVSLTSRYTLDARDPSARRELAAIGDLVGALRLPAGAFSAAAGTDVVADLLVFRRRSPGEAPSGPSWRHAVPAEFDQGGPDEAVYINEYFAGHPDHIVGRLETTRGMYRAHELTVTATGLLDDELPAALDELARQAIDSGLGAVSPAQPAEAVTPTERRPATGDFKVKHAQDGSFVVDSRGRVAQRCGADLYLYKPRVAKDRAELVRLIGLRDAARTVLAVQVEGGTDSDLQAAQEVLTERYGSYVRLYGPINRSSEARTGRTDPATGEQILRRVRPRMGGFRNDPDWPLVAALEVFDERSQEAQPAAIFSRRVVDPPRRRVDIDDPEEAVAVCLDESGTVTAKRVAELLRVDPVEARSSLGELVYDDPESGGLTPRAEYLSGNIRRKLTAAVLHAENDARFEVNVAALERVLPRQLEPSEISARPGATWIPPSDVEKFCEEVLGVGVDIEHLEDMGQWAASLRSGSRQGVALTSEWGTGRANAVTLLDAALNQRLHTVTDVVEGNKRVRNDRETLAARDKQEALAVRFSEWVWEDPQRAARLAGRYNELFASEVVPTFDGSHLTLPGLSATFVPRKHQRDAVARILTDGRALLAHEVGAGKTATMVMAAMEQRRLGHVTKPGFVVPNHMLEQFSREWIQLYPTAKILVADKDRLSKEHRKEFVARAATGDWDAIIFSQSSFTKLPLGGRLMREYLDEEIGLAQSALTHSKEGKRLSVKRIEKRLARLEETYKDLVAEEAKDNGVHWEETGIDYLYVDEAHYYKNLRVDSSIEGVGKLGSQRAQDLHSKMWALRASYGARISVFATATPVANSIAELWVMETFLHPDVLAAVGMRSFDSWAATFGRTITALELAPDGSSYRMKTRFCRFQNVPELLKMYRLVADVKTAEDLKLPTPAIVGGQTENVLVEPSESLREYMAELAHRAQKIRDRLVSPDEDNMLKVSGDGRRAALDVRLVGLSPDPGGGKTAAVARRIAGIYHGTREQTYADETGQMSLRPGTLQLAFCDASTPAGGGWNPYEDLRRRLVERGVPRESIRFMQDAKTDATKASLFAAARDGSVSVLIGSSDTMGTGLNVQKRLKGLHHVDPPWRPIEINQRNGRGLRQGNLNDQVFVIRYVTEGSFDIYMWQTLERKAAFISQITRGDITEREVDDIGDQALSFAEVKALASGDPLIMQKAGVDADVARLSRLERAHFEDQRRLRDSMATAQRRAVKEGARAARLGKATEQMVDTHGDRFRMVIEGRVHSKRAEAGAHLRRLVLDRIAATSPEQGERPPQAVGSLGGLPLALAVRPDDEDAAVLITTAEVELNRGFDTWADPEVDPTVDITTLERRLQRVPTELQAARANAEAALSEMARAEARIGQPWGREGELAGLKRTQQELAEQMEATVEPATTETSADREAPDSADTEHAPLGRQPTDDASERMRARLDALELVGTGARDPGGVEL